jgi:hypothetical protein
LQNNKDQTGLTGMTELTRGQNRSDPMDQDPTVMIAHKRQAAATGDGERRRKARTSPAWGQT